MFISRVEVIKIAAEDKLKDFISYKGNNMIPYLTTIEKITNFLSDHYDIIKIESME